MDLTFLVRYTHLYYWIGRKTFYKYTTLRTPACMDTSPARVRSTMSRRSLHSTASDSAGGSLIRVVEIPQQGYPPQSSFTPLETVWFDIRLKTLLYAQANAFPEEWSEPWTSGECGQKASFRVNASAVHPNFALDNDIDFATVAWVSGLLEDDEYQRL